MKIINYLISKFLFKKSMRHLKLASTLCIGLLTIGRKGGTFVRKSRHKKGKEKSHSDNTESQAKRELKPLV